MTAELQLLAENAGHAFRVGKNKEALDLANQALAIQPDNISFLLMAGMAEAKLGLADAAIRRFLDVERDDPRNFEAIFWLSMLYRGKRDYQNALKYGYRAQELRPNESNVYSNLGITQLAAQNLQAASAAFSKAISLDPRSPLNHFQLGRSLQLQGKDAEARGAYEAAYRIAPNSFDVLLALTELSLSQNRLDEALKYGNLALVQNPESVNVQLLLAGALIDQGMSLAAEYYIENALAAEQMNSNAYAMLGMRLQALGRMEEADEAFRKSIEIFPDQGFSYCALLRNSKTDESQIPMLEKMERIGQDAQIPPRGLGFLHFGLGKAFEDLGEYEKSMGHYDRANEISYRLKFGEGKLDRAVYSSYIDWTINTFTADFIERHKREVEDATTPIFIVGMIRSGTTLLEQILSSHPEVEGAGERQFWLNHAQDAITPGLKFLDDERLAKLASAYLKELNDLFPGAKYVTDKMPGNYRVLGLIAAAFPNAKIIHSLRNPIDTCLSIYNTPNRAATDFANNRSNIVFAYKEYQRLMRHWKSVIPDDRLLTVEYEQLVGDPEPTIRELVAFCGLPWDDRCLSPQNNERSVVTPSVWQVRQPVYSSSVERWRRFEPWLGEFLELVESK